MSGYLWLPQQATVPEPGEVVTYLQQQGWTLERPAIAWAAYAKEVSGEAVTLEVPLKGAARDYPRVFGILLENLSRLESRAPSAVLRDIKSVGLDIIRLAIDSSVTKDGRISVEAGRIVYQAARDLLLSAACSAIDPRPAFPKRKPDEAMKLLDRARFGQTEVGSFVLTMECTIAPTPQQALPAEGDDWGNPFERRACIQLAQALQGAEAATRESARSGTLRPFKARTEEGVSANLCDAVAEVIEATSADVLSASFSFATRYPLTMRVPRQVVLSGDAAPILRKAAAGLRDENTYPETQIVGPIVKLDSDDPDRGGVAVIRARINARRSPASVWVTLTARAYEQAMDAHRSSQHVRCTGELAREGRSWVLRNPRNFGLLWPGRRGT